MKRMLLTLGLVAVACGYALTVGSQTGQKHEVQQMYGSLLIDGYDFKKDIGPKGTIIYDEEKNEFRGTYIGLKMPQGRRSIFAWVHDTVNQKSEYLGPVGWLQVETGGKKKGKFTIKVPDQFKGGNFGSYELIGFTAEKTSYIKNGTEVVEKPTEPSGSDIDAKLKPAFYLNAPLPGADTQVHYCGHGGDFFVAKDLDKQFCYD
ncbi:MAG: hypothetical protein O7E52_19740 [Candidatus Poribacteria bacterium]|nr:hypothetical protein [Candidatus Poribacteria bacterium]